MEFYMLMNFAVVIIIAYSIGRWDERRKTVNERE